MNFYFLILLLFLLPACTTTSSSNKQINYQGMSIAWYDGGVDEAFKQGEDQNQPIFLYWGASWCPPCNELKAQVFTHKDAAELLKSSVNVYLDGDSELAQDWADRLKVTGYPTLLMLLPDGREIMRISQALTFAEFRRAYLAGLGQKETLKETLARAIAGRATVADWHTLAYFSWSEAKDLDLLSPQMLSQRLLIVDKIPDQMPSQRAILSASVLVAAMQAHRLKRSDAEESIGEIQKKGEILLGNVFKSYGTKRAARGFILYQSRAALEFLFTDNHLRAKIWKKKWLETADSLARDKTLSIDTRLWAIYPHVELAKAAGPNGINSALQNKVKLRVSQADKRAKTPYQRTAVIPGAASLLREVGLIAESRSLLKAEIKQTDSPWYYQSSIAALEEGLGHRTAALYWSDQARRSAKGRASKIQWTAADLMRTLRLADDKRLSRIRFLIFELYDLALKLDDGFVGRNRYRLDSVSANIKNSKYYAVLKKDLLKLKERCSGLSGKSSELCESHFDNYPL